MYDKNKLKNIPKSPGAYLMKDQFKKVIYIGKAKDLKNRITSYFNNKALDPKTRVLIDKIEYIEFIVTENEAEALILEDNLIKKYLPKYNILLKDDKRYPLLKISTTTDNYPKMMITRERKNNNDIYFGPYTNVRSLRNIITMLNRLFPMRKCDKKLKVNKNESPYLKPVGKPCLHFQMNQCLAPCQGTVDPQEYKKVVDQIILFLQGDSEKLIHALTQQMNNYSKNLDFEKAKLLRDRIREIKTVTEEQRIVTSGFNSQDIITLTEQNTVFNILIFFIREGKLVGKDNFIIKNKINTKEEVLNNFIKQFYLNSSFLPEEIIIPYDIEDKEVLTRVVKEKKSIHIRIPQTDIENKLMKMAYENANLILHTYFLDSEYKNTKKDLLALKQTLKLKRDPKIIEGIDISNIEGEHSVGSLVSFKNGIADKNEYRRFKIKTVEGIDDFKMIEEVVFRRYKRLLHEKRNLPDLILIDGGKGQLHAALRALKNLHLENRPIISLAKQQEEIFMPNREEPLVLPKNNKALRLLQRVRDEAHRFAISYHKQLRGKQFGRK